MKKIVLLLTCFVMAAGSLLAQDDEAKEKELGWKKGGMGTITYSEVGLFNWAAGGQSNMTLIGNLNLFANRTWENASWENSLDLAYGFIKNNFIFDPSAPITKAEDRIDFNSKFGRKAWSEKVYYSGLFNFRTQFAPGLANPYDDVYISRFMAPAYIVLALGLDYKPNDKLSIFFSPVSGKVTLVGDDSLAAEGAFGVNQLVNPEDPNSDFRPGSMERARMEFGATFRAKYKTDLRENVALETQLDLFSNYIDRPQNIDVRWTTTIQAKITKFISVNFLTDLIYDHDINIGTVDSKGQPIYSENPELMPAPYNDGTYWPGADFSTDPNSVVRVQRKGPKLQFKQVFGLGLVYKF